MKFDRDKHDIVDWRVPVQGEKWIDEFKNIRDDICLAPRPIAVERKRDLAWAVADMVRNPMREYTNGKEVGGRVRWNHDGYFEYNSPVDATSWRERVKPEAGSREAVAASAEVACWWSGSNRSRWFKRVGQRIEGFDTLTGENRDGVSIETFRREGSPKGWSPVLDSAGKPAEPVVGSQLWAQIVCRELGREVTQSGYSDSDGWYVWDGKEFVFWDRDGRVWGEPNNIVDSYGKSRQWKLRQPAVKPATSPILASLQSAQAALTQAQQTVGQAIAAAGGGK